MVQLAKATEGLTGSESENASVEAFYLAFDSAADGEKKPTDLDTVSASSGTFTLLSERAFRRT